MYKPAVRRFRKQRPVNVERGVQCTHSPRSLCAVQWSFQRVVIKSSSDDENYFQNGAR